MTTHFETYIRKLQDDLRTDRATELTYRTALENYMESLERGVKAASDPVHIACGAPDFILESRKVPLGYVETKDIGTDLNKAENSEQLRRYRKALNNLILTDYLEFRWYVNGEPKRTVTIARVGINHRLEIEPEAAAGLETLFTDFFTISVPTVTSPRELAERLAGITHFIRDQIVAALNSGDQNLQGGFTQSLNAFRDLLLPAITPDEFADLYAQAMSYGLFAAKASTPPGQEFTLTGAYNSLFGNRFLRRLFLDVSEELDEIEVIRPYLQDIVSLLNRTDFIGILNLFSRRTRTEDPVVHFYETFLAAYDPRLRKSRGVYYTPEPVVQFIVRAVDDLLKTRFNKPWGLADGGVKVLDPAAGTGTFLYFVIQQIYEEVVNTRRQAGQWLPKSRELLERIYGFELLMAPYVVTHLKLGLLLKELGAPLTGRDERMQVYLTNTLEEGISRAEQLTGMGSYIAEESSEAAQVKRMADIMVVLGNPPYSYESVNNGTWISALVRDYYKVDGAPLGEANPKGLQDDYVKFIRFGEWRINQTGHGLLAFITNHGYLDNPTFRGMRQHLMKTFDEIYVLDLHGNSKKKEKTPDGGKDENVFDIQQGVAILVAVKNPNGTNPKPDAVVHHTDLWGLREEKYTVLNENSMDDLEWLQIQPDKPFYLYVPQNGNLLDEYENGFKIIDIFPLSSVGLFSARDHFTIQETTAQVSHIIREFVHLPIEEARLNYSLGKDTRDWKIDYAQRDLINSNLNPDNIVPISYRPFDRRFTYYTGKSKGFHCMPRAEVMNNLNEKGNIALVSLRRSRSQELWNYIFVGVNIIDKSYITSLDNASIFPLYLYTTPEDTAGTLFAQSETTRTPNLSPAFIEALSGKLGLPFLPDGNTAGERSGFTPEDVFHYAYAVFHSPTYRTRYAEFLKIDFPRLPLTSDRELFFALADLGKELVGLHLLKSRKVDEFITSYPVVGSNRVEKVVFTSDFVRDGVALGKVWINDSQYFDGVPDAVWNFKIGGYQVCDKWLKDRKGRVLSADDLSHYQRTAVALNETIRLMAEIDRVIPGWPLNG